MSSDIFSYVLHTTPYTGFNPIPDVSALNLDNLYSLKNYGKDVFLACIENVTTYPEWLLGEITDATGALHNSTACAVVVVEKSAQDLDAFCFYFYSFNEGGDITQVLPPLDRIFPDGKPDGKPTEIYFSAHGSGEACDWDDEACLSKQRDRPVISSGRGSHANYPSEGHHIHDEALIDLADKGRIWDPIKPAYIYKYNPATDILAAAEPGTDPTDCFHFNGAWGDKKYTDSDPRQKTAPQFGLKKHENGPTGPKSKHLVRKGLFPDEPEKPNLMKMLVRWYMSMYGRCLKR